MLGPDGVDIDALALDGLTEGAEGAEFEVDDDVPAGPVPSTGVRLPHVQSADTPILRGRPAEVRRLGGGGYPLDTPLTATPHLRMDTVNKIIPEGDHFKWYKIV